MSVISGIISAFASEDAADAQKDASAYAADIQYKMYQQSRKDLMPFMEAEKARIPYTQKGLSDYSELYAEGPGDFESSDYYKTMESGISEAANALARQSLVSGAGAGPTGKALERYAVPYAAQQRGNWLNEWLATKLNPAGQMGMVGSTPYVGTASQLSQNALQTGSNLGNTALYGGEAQASGYLGRASALSNVLGTAGNVAMIAGMGGFGGGGGFGGSGGLDYSRLQMTPEGNLISF